MDQWANNGGTNTDAVLKAIDDSWPVPSKRSDGLRGASPTVARPATIPAATEGSMAVARTLRVPDSSTLRPADRRPDRPGRVSRRHPRPDRPAGWAEPPGLDLRRPRQLVGRRPTLRNGQGDQVLAKLLLAAIALVGGRRRHLAAVHRRGRLVEPAPGEVARPDPAVGLRRPGPRAAGRLPASTPRRGRSCAASRTTRAQFTLANFAVTDRARIHRDPAQQHHLADRRDRRQRGASACSSPGSSTASDARRWPRSSSSCRSRSRSSAHRSSGASSTPGSPPASRRSDS